MDTIVQRQGVGGSPVSLQVQRRAAKGGFEPAANLFDGSEPIQCVLWAGDDRAQATTLPCSWLDAASGTVKVQFPAATMAGLDVGWYQALVERTDLSQSLVAFRVQVEPGPGTSGKPSSYHTYADLTAELPWVGKLADYLQDQSGFAEVAGEARQWIDAAILRSVPARDWRRFGPGLGLGFGAGGRCSSWGSGSGGDQPVGLSEDPDVAAALAAGQLMTATATGRRFVRASVYYTLSKILRRSIGYKAANDLIEMAAQYRRDADALLASCVAEIDVNADGVPEYVFPLNRVQVRRA